MKNKFILMITVVTTFASFGLQSIVVAETLNNSENTRIEQKVDSKKESTKKDKTQNVDSKNKNESKIDTKVKTDETTGQTTPQTGVMGSMYKKKVLNLDITNKKSIQSSPVTIANRANSVLDTSEWQGTFNDTQVKNLKKQHKFIILRVQYGSNYRDKTFAHNVALMNKYGMKYGVYSFSQYINPSDAAVEARDLYNRAPKASFYVNDYEDQTVTSGGTDASTAAWLKEMRKHSGSKKVLFYSYASFMSSYAPNAMKKYDGYWLAAYQSNNPTNYAHVLWQYSSTYYSSALNQNVDASIATGGKNLDWFLAKNGNTAVNTSKDIIIKKNYNLWADLNFKKVKHNTKDMFGKPYHVKVYYKHTNGNTYYSVYTSDNQWLGYINKDAVKEITRTYLKKNVSINSRNQNLWTDFTYKAVKGKSSKYYDGNQNLVAKVHYKLSTGYEYYSLYDKNNKWQGYINTKFTSGLTAQAFDRNVTITKSYPIWKNLFWDKKSTAVIGKKYDAKYVYKTGNKKSYLSLYDSKGIWAGYINKEATASSNPEGKQIKTKKEAMLTQKGYTIWGDFKFTKKRSTSDKWLKKPVYVYVSYNHENGSTYCSLYDTSNKWIGYINKQAATFIDRSYLKQNVSINNRNQNLWTDFNYKSIENKSSKYYDGNQNLVAKVKYTISSGYSYYSLYDSKGKWQGYVNTKFTTPLKAKSYNKRVTIKDALPIWKNFFWNRKSTAVVGGKYTAKYVYTTGNKKSYLSLYDSKNKWIGYINKGATK